MLDKNKGNILLDYYEPLLTKHQVDILNDYFKEDLSMIEIAENYRISKAAVSDLIKRSYAQLTDYEKKLKLIAKDEKLNKIIASLEKGSDKDKLLASKLKKI